MTKHLFTALLSSLVTAMALYAVLPISAAAPAVVPAPADTSAFSSPDLSMPPPQAPFDMTPITPFETAGAPYEL